MTSASPAHAPARSLAGSIAIVGALFFVMGFFTWINGPLIAFVQLAFEQDEVGAFLVVFVFYISYFVFALPASWVLGRVGLKRGLALSLLVIAAGAAVFGQMSTQRWYAGALSGLFVIGGGLALLQTAANPYISILGPIDAAARRIALMGICNKAAGILAPVLLGTLVLVPTVLVVAYYFPKLDPWMNLLILLPFAVPPVVSSVGLLQIYADGPLPIVGTPWILIGTWFTVVLPFMYRALANSLQGVPLKDLMDAAHLLGASSTSAFALVVLPNLRKGLLAALFLSLSFLLGEFVFANMLVGTRYETLQVYLYNMRATSGHFTSALVMSYFLLTLLLTWAANRFHR